MISTASRDDAAVLLGESEAVLDRLGLDFQKSLNEVRAFLEGDPVLAIAGHRWSGKSAVEKHLQDDVTSIKTVEIPHDQGPGLWDTIVVTTPIEAALSDSDLRFIKHYRTLRRPVLVAVTGFGEQDDDIAGALDEVGRLRLAPRLQPLGVDWLPWGESEARGGAHARVLEMLKGGDSGSHDKPALDALSTILAAAVGQMEERVLVRDRQRRRLADEERSLPLAMSHLAETARMARLRLRDTLRNSRDDLHRSAEEMAGALDEWVIRGGRGSVDDATELLEDGWKLFVNLVGEALANSSTTFHAEATRVVARPLAAFDEMEIPRPQETVEIRSWFGEAVERARDRLVDLDLGPLLRAAVEEAEAELRSTEGGEPEQDPEFAGDGSSSEHASTSIRHRRESPGDEDIRWEELAAKARDAFEKIKEQAKGVSPPLLERLNLLVAIYMDAQVSVRLDKLLALASKDVENGARADVERYGQTLRGRVGTLHTALDERHNWTSDHLALTRLVERVDGVRRVG